MVSDSYDNVKKDDFYFDRREAELIGRLMMSPHELPLVASELQVADFGTPLHRQIWREMGKLYADGKAADFVSVLMALEASGVEFDRKHLSDIAELTIGSVKLLAPEVLLGAEKRRFEAIAKKLTTALEAGEDVAGAVTEAQDGLLSANYREEDKGLEPLFDPMMRATRAIEAAYRGEVKPGISTGFLALDNMISGGFRAGELYILAGRPAMGKTALGLQVAMEVALHVPVALFSLEMPSEQLCYRLISGHTMLTGDKLRRGAVNPVEIDQIVSATEELSRAQLHICDRAAVTVAYLRGQLRLLAARGAPPGLVVIDYLQLLREREGSRRTREQAVSEMSRGLKELAKEFACPVLCLSQLNRGVESRPNKRPLLSDLRESGSIEQDADQVWFVYRDEYYYPESEDKGLAEVIIAKNRAGSTGTVKLRFAAKSTSFAPLDDDGPPPRGGW